MLGQGNADNNSNYEQVQFSEDKRLITKCLDLSHPLGKKKLQILQKISQHKSDHLLQYTIDSPEYQIVNNCQSLEQSLSAIFCFGIEIRIQIAIRILRHIKSALDFLITTLHGEEFLHCNIEPANIFVSMSENYILGDFTLTKEAITMYPMINPHEYYIRQLGLIFLKVVAKSERFMPTQYKEVDQFMERMLSQKLGKNKKLSWEEFGGFLERSHMLMVQDLVSLEALLPKAQGDPFQLDLLKQSNFLAQDISPHLCVFNKIFLAILQQQLNTIEVRIAFKVWVSKIKEEIHSQVNFEQREGLKKILLKIQTQQVLRLQGEDDLGIEFMNDDDTSRLIQNRRLFSKLQPDLKQRLLKVLLPKYSMLSEIILN